MDRKLESDHLVLAVSLLSCHIHMVGKGRSGKEKEAAREAHTVVLSVVETLMVAMAMPGSLARQEKRSRGALTAMQRSWHGLERDRKRLGPNEYFGGPPGQGVKNECSPASL